jgi:tRNA nucleotidyltransferase (CCA-adding enzyme)
LIQNSQNWKHGEQLSLTEDGYPNFDTPLIFIDPVDRERNVASAISEEKFNLFVKANKAYVKNPSIKFFYPNKIKPWTTEKIRKKTEKTNYIGLKTRKPDIIAENLYPQIRKATRSITELCERHDFKITDSKFYVDEKNNSIYIVINPEKSKLPKTKIHMGPPVTKKDNADDFIKKWENNPKTIKNPYKKDKRYYVKIEREYTKIKDLLKGQMKNLSLGKHIDPVVKEKFKILELDELLIDNLREFWTENLDKKMPWER